MTESSPREWLARALDGARVAVPARYDPTGTTDPQGDPVMGQAEGAGRPVLLVVDDEPDLRALLGEYFGRHGFEVLTAEDAARARAILAGTVPDVVLLDINMPGENGLSLARWLRDAHPRLGVVMLTTAGESVDRIVGLELGAHDAVDRLARWLRDAHPRLGVVMLTTAGERQAVLAGHVDV